MFSFRSEPGPAGQRSALAILIAGCALLLALPAAALAAPEGGEAPPPPQLAFEPGSYDFGLQEANRSNGQTTLQLRNVGEAATQVNFLDLAGSGSNAFSLGAGDCGGRTLNPGETCWVQVNFAPYDAVPFSAQLRAYAGEGIAFTANLSGEGGRAIVGPAIDPTSFGAVPVGSPGVTKTIEITNRGNMAGGFFIAVVAGGAVGSFHLLDENCTGVPLTPSASCDLLVSFQPIETGAMSARIGLFGDSDGGALVNLNGVGLPAEEEASPADAPIDAGALPKPRGKHGSRAHRRHTLRSHRRRFRAELASRRPSR